MKGVVYSLFDRTQNMLAPWVEAGFPCVSIDILPPRRVDGRSPICQYVVGDINLLDALVDPLIVFGFPPCTDMAISGARWFASKGPEVIARSLSLFTSVVRLSNGAPAIIENPVGRFSTYYRKPDCIVHPWEFSGYSNSNDHYTKATCQWLINGGQTPLKHPGSYPIRPGYSHRIGPGPDRQFLRSVTPEGFARGVFAANAPRLFRG